MAYKAAQRRWKRKKTERAITYTKATRRRSTPDAGPAVSSDQPA